MSFIVVSREIVPIWYQLVEILHPEKSDGEPSYRQIFATMAFYCYKDTSMRFLFKSPVRDFQDLSSTLPYPEFWLNRLTNPPQSEIRQLIVLPETGKMQIDFLSDSCFNDDFKESPKKTSTEFQIHKIRGFSIPLGQDQIPFSVISLEGRPSEKAILSPGKYMIRFSYIKGSNPKDYSHLMEKTLFEILGPNQIVLRVKGEISCIASDDDKLWLFDRFNNWVVGNTSRNIQTDILLATPPQTGVVDIDHGGLNYLSGIQPVIFQGDWPKDPMDAHEKCLEKIPFEQFTPRDPNFLITALVQPKVSVTI